MTTVDIQFSATHADWPRLRDATLRAEQARFGAVWVFDHLAGRSLGGTRSLECFTWLGALASITTSIELGSLVTNVYNRGIGTTVVAAASVAEVSQRQFYFGLGAGTSPNSPFAAEQHVVGATIEPDIDARHRRVGAVLDQCDAMWSPNRDEQWATFPLPSPRPLTIVGTNSITLSELAGARADGVNVRWDHPRALDFLDAASDASGSRPFLRTTFAPYSADLLDPSSATRQAMIVAGIDRLILTAFDPDLVSADLDVIGLVPQPDS